MTSSAKQTIFEPDLQNVLLNCRSDSYKMAAIQRKVDAILSSKVWWIENPEVLLPTDPSHLCIVCRHIDFRYLLNSPPRQLLEKVPLSSLEQIVQNKECSFCRLVTYTIQLAFEEEELPFEIEGKQVTCELQMLPLDTSSNGPRQLCIYLNVLPRGKAIDASTDLLIYETKDERYHTNQSEKQKTITMSEMNISTIKYWYSTCLDGKCGGSPCQNPSANFPGAFRLIDVITM